MAEDAQIPYNCVAWTLLEGYPWSPVYVFDPNQVRENLELLGNSHQHHLKKARDWPNVYRLVYNFGYHNISLLSLGQYIKPWQCTDHLRFLNGYPHECMNRRDVVEAFREALIEAQAFLATDNRSRMLPNMTVSDFYYDDQQPVVPAPVPSILSTPPPLPIAYQVHNSSHSSGALTDDTGPEPSSLGQSGSSITGRPENLAPTTSATAPPQEQPTIPLRRTRARTQLDRDSSASQDKGVPGLPPAPDAAKLLRSPQDTMKPTRQSAKAKTPPTKPPKQVDGRSTRKPKLPLPPSEEVKRPAATAAKKKIAARPKGPKKGNNPAIPPPNVGPHKAISTSHATTTPPWAYEKQTDMLTLRHDGLDNAPTVPQLYPNHLMTLAEVSSSPPVDIPNNSIVWAHVHGMSWWPAIVLDPFQVKPVLHFLGHAHDAPLKKARKQPKDVRLAFVFGRYVFCSLKKKMKRWQCPEHDTFIQGPTSLFTAHPFLADVFADGVHQAQNFLGAQTLNQYIPYVHASDLSSTTALPPPQVQFNAVAWAKRDEVWWPVFLCDPRTLRSNLFHLGTGELPHCRVATGLPFHNRIAYYFGMHDFGLYADDSLLKRWFCSEHVSFIKGHVDASVTDRLKDALKQVQEFFVAEEGHRTMLCKLVGASDDVSPPPPQLHSFVDGARVVPESHQVVLALYRPSSNPTRKAMLDDGAADKAPYDVLTMHTTRFKPTDLDALNQIMNAPNPQRPADEKHGLTPMLPFLSDQVDVTEVQVPNEDIDAAVVQVLHNLVDAIAQYHAATNDSHEEIEEVDTPMPLAQTDETHEATAQEDSDANDMQEPDESHRSIQYAMDDIVASIEAIQCEDQEIEAMRSAAKTDDGAMLVGEGDWCVDLNLVAWGRKSEHHPWWPVYSCDPRRLRSHLHYMGVRHRGLLLQARRHAATLRLVYYFGRHTL
ncbi:hypothetical protein AaE_006907 [Aphanomyces astaci]|uniref:PWWP domain-containing protein n=1 Tax=Aphanomyces astaci TaxID=112090 RepID=A0A6A5AG46_APHAT|nr:hypothetical protein AaE_006907 [Aphanomyces astaci]